MTPFNEKARRDVPRAKATLAEAGPTAHAEPALGVMDGAATPASSPGDQDAAKVLYVAGYGRSGSTLFDRMLGEFKAFTSTGELAYIWTRALGQDRLCGCGVRFTECPFWRRVGEVAFGGWDAVDVDDMIALYRRVNRHRYLPFLLFPALSSSYNDDLRQYAEVLSSLYRAIRDVSGSRVIVDSTTDPSYGFLLRHVPGLDLRVVHLVRDSRGTAFSWTRKRILADVVDRQVEMKRFRPSKTAIRWTLYHLLVHLMSGIGVPSVRVRYEDLVNDPKTQILRATKLIDEGIEGHIDLDAFRPGEFELGPSHTVAGNGMRFRCGRVPLRLDDEWTRAMPPRQRRLVTALSWPLLRLYDYVGSVGRL